MQQFFRKHIVWESETNPFSLGIIFTGQKLFMFLVILYYLIIIQVVLSALLKKKQEILFLNLRKFSMERNSAQRPRNETL